MNPFFRVFLSSLLVACYREPIDRSHQFVENPLHDSDGDGLTEQEGDCNDQDATEPQEYFVDSDGDGFGHLADSQFSCLSELSIEYPDTKFVVNNLDCDDSNETVHPNAFELCDEMDNDCDEDIDEDAIDRVVWFVDADEDGFGDANSETLRWCLYDPPEGYTLVGSDCNDLSEKQFPGNIEICDEVDNDCDGDVDDNDDSLDLNTGTTFYADVDADGFGDPASPQNACIQPAGYVVNDLDCDDSLTGGFTHPNRVEICDGIDNDCDGDVDDDDVSLDLNTGTTFYADVDADGFGDPNSPQDACVQPADYVTDNQDCDDSETGASNYPDAPEICDGVDNDCDVFVDEEVQNTYYLDFDGDGFGDLGQVQLACTLPSGYSDVSTDCDDSDEDQFPNNPEFCDGKDNNCDGTTDEGVLQTFYLDRDEDGFGDSLASVEACEAVVGYVPDPADCDDFDQTQYPDAPETCNQEDDDCDGFTDEGEDQDAPLDAPTWYLDFDEDGYGTEAATIISCYQPTGFVDNLDDCADGDSTIHPASPELCDNLDQDCDGQVDNDPVNGVLFYRDQDGDGDGEQGTSDTVEACYILNTQTQEYEPPVGYADLSEDCNDSDATVSSLMVELCTLDIDENCDGDMTLGAIDPTEWFVDADDDDFGNSQYSILSCPILNQNTGLAGAPSGYADNAADCNDLDADLFPGNTEICNGKLDDCDQAEDADGDGIVEYTARFVEIDHDQDGYIECDFDEDDWVNLATLPLGSGDCQPLDDDVFPDAPELCTGEVEDCNSPDYGLVPENESDDDGDGYVECEGFIGIGWEGDPNVFGGGDCDDSDSDDNGDGILDGFHTYPGAAELYPTAQNPDLQLCLADNDENGEPDCVRISSNPTQPAPTDYECEFGIYLTTEIGPDFVLIPAGVDPAGRYELTHDFYMMTTEVTRGMYQALVGSDPSYYSPNSPSEDYPVENLSWADAANFANLLSDEMQLDRCYDENNNHVPIVAYSNTNFYECPGYRLPTEAEWEYAARSGYSDDVAHYEDAIWTPDGGGILTGHGTSMYIDDGGASPSISLYVWYSGNNLPAGTKQVARLYPNGFGLYDMHGNVQEMTNDWATVGSPGNFYTHAFPSNGSQQNGVLIDPFGATSGTVKVLRGGTYESFYDYQLGVTASIGIYSSSAGEEETGFRLVRTNF